MLQKQIQKLETLKAYKRLFSSDDGKIVIKDLIRHAYATTSTPEALSLAHAEGKRHFVAQIFKCAFGQTDQLEKEISEALEKSVSQPIAQETYSYD